MTFIKMIRSVITPAIRDEEGVTAVEYGLIAALIAVVIAVAVTTLGTDLSTLFTTVGTKISG